MISLFGWTPDEYEDGERKQQDIELDDERNVLLQDNGFKIFKIERKKTKSAQEEAVWSKAASQFYQTMSSSQANFVIHSVSIICNTQSTRKYNAMKSKLMNSSKIVQEEWGFHGTSDKSIDGIAKEGFRHPDELVSNKSKKIVPLDDGYFGKGIYFSLYSDYALYYSNTRQSNRIMLCRLLTGKVYKCKGRKDGEGLMKGYDSHYSPKGNEIIIFNGDQILPRYIIEFEERDAEEREQEY